MHIHCRTLFETIGLPGLILTLLYVNSEDKNLEVVDSNWSLLFQKKVLSCIKLELNGMHALQSN